jgi:hypothetical protein
VEPSSALGGKKENLTDSTSVTITCRDQNSVIFDIRNAQKRSVVTAREPAIFYSGDAIQLPPLGIHNFVALSPTQLLSACSTLDQKLSMEREVLVTITPNSVCVSADKDNKYEFDCSSPGPVVKSEPSYSIDADAPIDVEPLATIVLRAPNFVRLLKLVLAEEVTLSAFSIHGAVYVYLEHELTAAGTGRCRFFLRGNSTFSNE